MNTRETPPLRGKILVTGATGYVGGRLAPLLHRRGLDVRCLARRPEHLIGRIPDGIEIVRGDLLRPESLPPALAGVHTAFYLAHSLGTGPGFEETEELCAQNFARAAREAGVSRIIYVGGLGADAEPLSPHLRSRQRVGRLLHGTGVPVIELRASIVIGSGSLSFEMVRSLVERLPVMILPRWVTVEAQPIAIQDLLTYLTEALTLDVPDGHTVFEVGGAERTSYEGLMRAYARYRGLKRLMLRVPVLTPRLSSLWLGLVTPIFAPVGRLLIESIRHSTIVRDERALRVFSVRPVGVDEAIVAAIANEDEVSPATRWADPVSSMASRRPWRFDQAGSRVHDVRERLVSIAPEHVFRVIERIGGRTGWYYGNWLWTIRGWLDLAVGGVGMRRGRRDPELLRVGDVLDCWRVVRLVRPSHLQLAAEMRLPGRATLEWELRPQSGGCNIRQTASFDPAGWSGRVYWYLLYPIHHLLFTGMLRNITRAASKEQAHAA